jgi:hypothetical protein
LPETGHVGVNRVAHDLDKTERELRRLIEAINGGVSSAAVKDEITALEARRRDRSRDRRDGPGADISSARILEQS